MLVWWASYATQNIFTAAQWAQHWLTSCSEVLHNHLKQKCYFTENLIQDIDIRSKHKIIDTTAPV